MRSKGKKDYFIDPRENVESGATIDCHLRY